MQINGKWLILLIFGTALAMAVFAWSFQFVRGRRVLALYGADAARLIRVDADQISLLVLAEGSSGGSPTDDEHLDIGGEHWPIVDAIDISNARGLIHARQALIEDSSYEWDRPPSDCPARWNFALRFSQKGQRATATAAFDSDCRRLRIVETGAEAPLAKHFLAGMQTFVDEQLQPPEK